MQGLKLDNINYDGHGVNPCHRELLFPPLLPWSRLFSPTAPVIWKVSFSQSLMVLFCRRGDPVNPRKGVVYEAILMAQVFHWHGRFSYSWEVHTQPGRLQGEDTQEEACKQLPLTCFFLLELTARETKWPILLSRKKKLLWNTTRILPEYSFPSLLVLLLKIM